MINRYLSKLFNYQYDYDYIDKNIKYYKIFIREDMGGSDDDRKKKRSKRDK